MRELTAYKLFTHSTRRDYGTEAAETLTAADCSTWVRRNGSWAYVAHSEAVSP